MSLFSNILPTFLNKTGEWVENVSEGVERIISKAKEKVLSTPEERKEKLVGLKDFIIDAARQIPRDVISLGLEAEKQIRRLPEEDVKFIPKDSVQKLVLGKEPIFGTAKTGEDLLKKLGVEEATAKKYGQIAGLPLAILSVLPGGKSEREIAEKSIMSVVDLSKMARNSLENLETGIKPGSLERAIKEIKVGILPPVKVKRLEDGAIFIEDGRHHLEAAKRLGIKNYPIEDVSDVAKIGLKERGFITSAKETLPIKVAGQYIPRDTDELAIKARNLIKDDINTAENLALTGTDEKAIATASELLKHYADEADKASELSVKNALYDQAAKIANAIAPKLTESGRTIQAASILGRLTPEGQVRFAAGQIAKYNEALPLAKRIPELTGEQTKYIINEMKVINEMGDSIDKAMRFQKLQEFVNDLVPTPLFKKITAIWKAGLLTGLKTTGLNILSTLSHVGTEVIKDIPATIIDKAISLITGERKVAFTTRGLTEGAKTGLEKGLKYLRTGFDERNIGTKLDYKKVNFGEGKLAQGLQAYTDTVFRLLGAEDQPFYYAAKLRSLYEQARVIAINNKLKGSEAQKYIDNLIQNPTDEMILLASEDAVTAVFQNRTLLGKAAKAIQDVPGGEIIVPFGKTPSAVATQIINYSPIGIAKTIYESFSKGKFDQRIFSKGLGRALTGIGAMALGTLLYKKGFMTLDRPKGEKEQKLWELEGRKENSVYDPMTKEWRSIQVLGPAGNVILLGGHFKNFFDKSGSPTSSIIDTLAGASKSFTEQTFLTGVSNFIEALSDPTRSAENVAGSTLASTIPTIVSDIARATDERERRSKTILDKLQARIPGLRERLEPRINVLGEEVESIGNPLEIMLDPTRPSPVKTTPVINELRRLWDANYRVSPTLLGDKAGYKGLTPEQNTDLWKRAGEITNKKLDSLFNKDQYQALADDRKAKIVNDIIDKSKLFARVEKVLELTEGLERDDLLKRLKELKTSGLMSREVFNEYQRLR